MLVNIKQKTNKNNNKETKEQKPKKHPHLNSAFKLLF